MSKLLINEHPLQVLPTLAVKVGLNEAIFLQQLHYWLNNPKMGKEHEGRKYILNSFEDWQETNFPFWSIATIKRLVTKLKKQGLVLSTGRLNKMQIDRTQWYTIDYDALEAIQAKPEEDKDMAIRKCQNDTLAKSHNDTLAKCQSDTTIVSKCADTKYQNDTTNNQRLPETTTDIKEGGKQPPPAPKPKKRKKPKKEIPKAVEIYRKELHLYPTKPVWGKITDMVDGRFDEWRGVCQAWALQQYKPGNLTGLFDWLNNGIPDYAIGDSNGQATVGNGKSGVNGKEKGIRNIPGQNRRAGGRRSPGLSRADAGQRAQLATAGGIIGGSG